MFPFISLHFARVVDDAKCIVGTRICVSVCVCVSVCLSAAIRPHYYTSFDVTWGRDKGCPLVVHCWADLQSVHGLRCCGNNVKPSLRGVCAHCWLVTGGWRGRCQNCAPYIASARGWLAGDWPSTGGVLNITAAAWTAGFQWWRSGDRMRTQKCLVSFHVVLCRGTKYSEVSLSRSVSKLLAAARDEGGDG